MGSLFTQYRNTLTFTGQPLFGQLQDICTLKQMKTFRKYAHLIRVERGEAFQWSKSSFRPNWLASHTVNVTVCKYYKVLNPLCEFYLQLCWTQSNDLIIQHQPAFRHNQGNLRFKGRPWFPLGLIKYSESEANGHNGQDRSLKYLWMWPSCYFPCNHPQGFTEVEICIMDVCRWACSNCTVPSSP